MSPQHTLISTIFSTKNKELAIFGQTLTDVRNKLIDFNDVIMQGGSFGDKSNKPQLIADNNLYKVLSRENASEIVTTLNSIKDGTNSTYQSMDDYLTYLDGKGRGYIKNYVKENQNQIYVTDDVIQASKNARQAQLDHNAAIQASTLSAKAGQIALKGLAIAGNMIAMWAITKGIELFVKWVDESIVTTEEHKEQLETLKNEYSDITSSLKDCNDELKTTQERMKELEGLSSPSFAEKEEYDNLVKQNNELERKIALLEYEQKVKNREKNKAFVDTMVSDTQDQFEYTKDSLGNVFEGNAALYSASGQNYSLSNEQEYINQQIERRIELAEKLASIEVVTDETTEERKKQIEEETNALKSQIEEIDTYLQGKSVEWGINATEISYISNPSDDDEKAVNAWLDFIADFQDKMLIIASEEGSKNNAFNRIVDNWKFDELTQGLQDLGSQGKVTADMLADPKYDEFIAKLVELGIIDSADNLEDIALSFNKVAEAIGGLNPDEMSIQMQDIFSFENTEGEATALSTLNDQLSEVKDAYKTCLSAKEEYDKQGYLSVDTLQEVLSLGDDYLQYLFDEQGNVKLDAEAFKQLSLARINDMEAQALNNLAQNIQQITDEATATEYLAEKQNELASSYTDVAVNALMAMRSISGFGDSEALQSAYNSFKTQYEQIKSLFASTRSGLDKEFSGVSTSAIEDATKKTKEYIDSYMEFQEKSLENGTIDYHTYCNTVSNLLKSMYKEGKLSAQDYHTYTKQMLESQLDIYDKAISGIAYIIDKEVESLEKQKESIESTYKTKIDAIQSEIDLRKKAYEQRKEEDELNDAIYNKERARNQKTNLQFVNGQMVYTPDGTAIKDAEKVLADKKHEMEISRLESQIESLEKAMESEISTIDKEIKKYEEYKKQIQDVTKEYENAENVKYALAVTGLNNEAEILECRIDVLNTFRENYIAIQKAIANAAWDSARAQVEAQNYANGNGDLGDSPKMKPLPPQETITTTKGAGNNKNLIGQHHTITKYHDGINKGYVGEGVSKDEKLSLLKSIANGTAKLNLDEVPAILKKREVVLTEAQQSNIIKYIAQNPIMPNITMPKYDYTKFGNRNDNSVTMNGDINITCPGVTSQEVVKQVDAALRHEFFGMNNKAKQRANITR